MSEVNKNLAKEIDALIPFEDLAKKLSEDKSVWFKVVADLAGKQLEKHDESLITAALDLLESKIPDHLKDEYAIVLETFVKLLKNAKKGE